MKTMPLGNTGEQVSALCLGAMYFGSKNNKATSYNMLDQYVGAGGSFIDTANIYAHWISGYSGGESEALLGEWMRERGNRNDVFIASKVGFAYPGIQVGLSAKQIEEECNKSLEKLGIETIDLYYAHVDDRNTPLEETLEAFSKLVQAGKVRYIGASNYLAWRLEEAKKISNAQGWPEFCCVQQRYTYFQPKPGESFDPQTAVNDDLLDYVKNRGITLLAYSALLGGAYTRTDREIPPQYYNTDKRLANLKSVADELNTSVNTVILAWMLQSDPAVLPLIAASTETQMEENLAALELTLSAEQMALLNTP